MKLTALLDTQRKRVEVQGIELYFQKLSWTQLVHFQETVEEFEQTEKEKADDDLTGTIGLCRFILENYVTDEDGDAVIDPEQVEGLPVEFCMALVEKFTSSFDAGADLEKK